MSVSRRSVIIVLLLTLMAGSLWASEPESFSTLEEHMTEKQFHESGLHKLTKEELAVLDRWIRDHSITFSQQRGDEQQRNEEPQAGQTIARDELEPPEPPKDTRGLPAESDDRPVNSRIVGSFNGWDGNTEFELENGMVWRQAERGSFPTREMHNPEVEIRPGMFGTWNLSVEGYNRRVRVERIR